MKKDKRNKRKNRLQRKRKHQKGCEQLIHENGSTREKEGGISSNTPERRIKGLRYNLQKKDELDKTIGQDSIDLLNKKSSEYIIDALNEKCSTSPASSAEERKDILLESYRNKIHNCAMMKYFLEELEIPQEEGLRFFEQITDDILAEKLQLKDYKEYRFDRRSPVRLLFDGNVYQIKHESTTKQLACETLIIMDKWAFGYNHFDEVGPWNNGTFFIYRYKCDTNELVDHPSAIIDHYLLFNHFFKDGVLFADDLARFVEYQFSDMERGSDDYSDS